MKKKILIIGGAGYVGTELCNKLSQNKKYLITCLDNFWFGDKVSKKVKKIKKDIRNLKNSDFKNFHTVIHLAYLSNDPLCELNGRDAWECGPLALYSILEKCDSRERLPTRFHLTTSDTHCAQRSQSQQDSPNDRHMMNLQFGVHYVLRFTQLCTARDVSE